MRVSRALTVMRHGAPAKLIAAAALTGCTFGYETPASKLASLERGSYTFNGRTVEYFRAGDPDGRRVIYVHGTPGDATNFAGFLSEPIAGLEHVAVDRLGFGRSDPRAVTGFAEQAASLGPLLVERGGRWPILVGHSLGGPIVARLAADHPERVGGLVIVSGSLDPALEKPRWFNHVGDTWLARPVMGRALRNSNDELMAAPKETRELDAILDRVTCPVVVIHGTRDKLVPAANVDYMRGRWADAEFVVLEGENHFIPWTRPETIRGAVEKLAR